jgi:hypothetical protein
VKTLWLEQNKIQTIENLSPLTNLTCLVSNPAKEGKRALAAFSSGPLSI